MVAFICYTGLPGSGKSTLARSLCADGEGVRFTLGEWMFGCGRISISNHANTAANRPRYATWSGPLRSKILLTRADVAFDWNSWSADRRRWAVDHAAAGGAPVILHKVTADIETASEQARMRTERGTTYAHAVTPAGNLHLAGLMEEPASEEGIEIRDH